MILTYGALWCFFMQEFQAGKGADLRARGGAVHIEAAVLPWLRAKAEQHKTVRLWVGFFLDYYPPYPAFRMATRTANYRLRVAALRATAHFFAATGKVEYQWVCATHIVDLTRMTDECLEVLRLMSAESVTTVKWL